MTRTMHGALLALACAEPPTLIFSQCEPPSRAARCVWLAVPDAEWERLRAMYGERADDTISEWTQTCMDGLSP